MRETCVLLSSRTFLNQYLQYSESLQNKVLDLLDLLSQALVSLDKHALVLQMSQQIVSAINDNYPMSLFVRIRLSCIWRVLCYCDEVSAQANIRPEELLIDFGVKETIVWCANCRGMCIVCEKGKLTWFSI
ncbi:hypothetical protein EON65_32955 [archaeon]|nr:MAG: hypothetical protein EON65_32955 [archaeon]